MMNSNALSMAIGTDRDNHDLIIEWIANGLIKSNELLLELFFKFQSQFDFKQKRTHKKTYYLFKYIKVVMSWKKIPQCPARTRVTVQYKPTEKDEDVFIQRPNKLKGFPKHITSIIDDHIERAKNPQLYLTKQKISEVAWVVHRDNKKAFRKGISPEIIQKLHKLVKKSNYESILFLFGHKFILHLYDVYVRIRWFDEAYKITHAIERANEYFNPEVKLDLNL